MFKDGIVPSWLKIVFSVCCVLAMMANLVPMPQAMKAGLVNFLMNATDILAYLMALLYCITGFKKESALFFKAFCIAYSLAVAAPIYARSLYLYGVNSQSTAALLMTTGLLSFGCLCVFFMAGNLGRVKSMGMSSLILLCSIVDLPFAFTDTSDVHFWVALRAVGKVSLAVMFMVMVYAKYEDKVKRGSK